MGIDTFWQPDVSDISPTEGSPKMLWAKGTLHIRQASYLKLSLEVNYVL